MKQIKTILFGHHSFFVIEYRVCLYIVSFSFLKVGEMDLCSVYVWQIHSTVPGQVVLLYSYFIVQ